MPGAWKARGPRRGGHPAKRPPLFTSPRRGEVVRSRRGAIRVRGGRRREYLCLVKTEIPHPEWPPAWPSRPWPQPGSGARQIFSRIVGVATRRSAYRRTLDRSRAGDPDRSTIRPLAPSRRAAPGAVWLGAGMLYRGDDARRLARLAAIAGEAGVPLIAVGDVLYHAPERRPLQDVMTCIREHLMLAAAGRRLAGQCGAPSQDAGRNGAAVPRRPAGRRADLAVSRALPVFARRIALRISRRNPRRFCHAAGSAGRLYGGQAPARAIRTAFRRRCAPPSTTNSR